MVKVSAREIGENVVELNQSFTSELYFCNKMSQVCVTSQIIEDPCFSLPYFFLNLSIRFSLQKCFIPKPTRLLSHIVHKLQLPVLCLSRYVFCSHMTLIKTKSNMSLRHQTKLELNPADVQAI